MPESQGVKGIPLGGQGGSGAGLGIFSGAFYFLSKFTMSMKFLISWSLSSATIIGNSVKDASLSELPSISFKHSIAGISAVAFSAAYVNLVSSFAPNR